jgi:hypothetical protein
VNVSIKEILERASLDCLNWILYNGLRDLMISFSRVDSIEILDGLILMLEKSEYIEGVKRLRRR